jgi:FMN phosphatase YigB (HAD superfamily)
MFSPNGIKAILFDLDGTLRHNEPEGGDVFVERARSLGLSISANDRMLALRWEHYYWANSPEVRADLGKYQESDLEFWINYGRRHLVALGISQRQAAEMSPIIARDMRENHKPSVVLAQGAHNALTQLKQAGFKLGVVSNRENPYSHELDQLGITPFFDFSLAAGEVQSYKPQPGIFEAALQRIETPAEAAMYVGDNYFADVVGAKRAGLRPVLYDPRGIYPDAACAVIASFDGLSTLLK